MGIKRKVTVDGETFEVELEKDGEDWRVSIDGSEFEINVEDNRGIAPRRKERSRSGSVRSGTISSPIPGKVVSIHVSVGDYVEEGSVLMILEAMKMQNEVQAPISGTVAELNCQTGDSIEANSALVVITPEKTTSE
ncbi:MAG: biotin/lipoyl-containing protein [Candidatus Thermoplasmatota archaeon]|nr:biotin/lipoyl-containing protein [Candidatus Thermoplasmatota archaeon]MEE3270012.1 biotin/lipoyl-containing protein [Candidatus Thermoplasmatota archaeon]